MTLTTTPTFAFDLSEHPTTFDDIIVTFYQCGVPRLVKHIADISWEATTGTLVLTECETQHLNHSTDVIISVAAVREGFKFEIVKIRKLLYYIFGEKLKVGFEDETVEIEVNVSSITKTSQIQVNASVINAISPTAVITDLPDGAKITITDKNGVTEQVIYDGEKGEPGHYTAGNGIDIKDDTISVKDLILDCDSSTELGG